MHLTWLLSTLVVPCLVAAAPQTVHVYTQPLGSSKSPKPVHLADVSYDTTASTSSISNYEAPDLDAATSLVRVGLYDPRSASWISGTTIASVENFARGYAPTITLATDRKGDVLSVGLKGIAVDAGVTRDFGPKALVMVEGIGKEVELNKPVVLSTEGKRIAEQPEKSFLQKYWWMIAIAMVLAVGGGGGDK